MNKLQSRWPVTSSGYLAILFCVSVTLLAAYRMDAADPGTSGLEKLLKEKVSLLEKVASQIDTLNKAGAIGYEEVYDAHQELEKARLELCKSDPERRVVLQRMLENARHREDHVKAATVVGLHEKIRAEIDRLDVEIALERLRS